MYKNVPSCHLASTNPIKLRTLRCSGGPYASKSIHRHAKTCLEPPDTRIDMCLTYIYELILAQIDNSCSGEHYASLARKSKQPPTDRTSSCSSGNDRRQFLSKATTTPAYMDAQVKVHVQYSSLPFHFHRGVHKYSPQTSGITNKTPWQCYFVDLIVNVLRGADFGNQK